MQIVVAEEAKHLPRRRVSNQLCMNFPKVEAFGKFFLIPINVKYEKSFFDIGVDGGANK
jgi:hypothetical protein